MSITSDVFQVTSLQEDVPGSSDMADVVGSGSDDDRKGVRDLLARELVDGVEQCSLIYLSVFLSLERSALAHNYFYSFTLSRLSCGHFYSCKKSVYFM